MILKELYLYPDLVDFSSDIVRPFRDRSRSICNFLEREIGKIKFQTEGFKRICFIGKASPKEECFINSSKVLIVEVTFNENEYSKLDKANANSMFSKMLLEGIDKCKAQCDIPYSELQQSIAAFEKNGYVNHWIHKSKNLKDLGLIAELQCDLTMDNFILNLVLKNNEIDVFNKEILRTEPDELVFTPLFKDILYSDHTITVVDKWGDTVFNLNVDKELQH